MRTYLLTLGLILGAAACGGSGGGNSQGNGNSPPPDNAVTPIYTIQGSGAASPLEGQAVTVQGIVTGDFQDGDADDTRNLGGFYLQHLPDGDFDTSDGVFVFDGNNPAVDVNAGDSVRVTGVVNEHFGETQVSANSVTVVGAGSLIPAPVTLPTAATTLNSDGQPLADLERYEGMLVRFPQALTVAGLRTLQDFGDVILAQGGRPFQFTNGNTPDVAGYSAHRDAIASRRLILDDGLRALDATPIRYLNAGGAPGYSIRIGDQVTNLTGNLRYSRGSGSNGAEAYRLMPTEPVQFESMNPRTAAPVAAGKLSVASFNVLNFFSTIDTGASVCGPAADSGCRGADSTEELDRQLAKLVSAIGVMDADIVGLVELENNADASLRMIVDALNTALGAGTYDYVDAGTIGNDVIKVGFIYQPAAVGLAGAPAILDAALDARFNDDRNRPVLAQTFEQVADGARVTVAINHLKSKGSSCDDDGDPNLGDGQGNCNLTRTNAAAALAEWLLADPTGSGDPDSLIIGDLNAYLLEDPLTTLKSLGFVSLLEDKVGTSAYSFSFDEQAGALDHALVSPSLASQVSSIDEWHINADEPRLLDYNLDGGRNPALFDGTTPYRASDHDPLIIGLELDP